MIEREEMIFKYGGAIRCNFGIVEKTKNVIPESLRVSPTFSV
jgi:hypothetical protein